MLIDYRCKVCGAPVDPETGYCKYCDTLNFKPIKKPMEKMTPRLIVRDDAGNEAKLNPSALSIDFFDDLSMNMSMGRDYEGRLLVSSVSHKKMVSFHVKTQAMTLNLVNILQQPVYEAVFTGFRLGYGHEFRAYTSDMELPFFSVNSILTTSFDVNSFHPLDFWNEMKVHNTIMEGIRCPICGAELDPEKSKCDYCGYWWIYSPEGR